MRRLILLLALAACGDDGSSRAPATPDLVAPDDVVDPDARTTQLPSDPVKAIAQLGAIPAWEAVVQRDQYLGRRGQRGIVYGRVGAEIFDPAPPVVPAPPPAVGLPFAPPVAVPPPAPAGATAAAPLAADPTAKAPGIPTGKHWLVDDSEGNGALAIRVAFPADEPAKEGARVAVGGAWVLDDQKRWYWHADEIIALPGDPASSEAIYPPGHVTPIMPVPKDIKPASKAVDNGAILFQIAIAPRQVGEGWKITDELGSPLAATLHLPGERPSYGGHDLRMPDERWQLRRAVAYWVRIGRVRRKDKLTPPVLNAVTPPARAW